MREKYEGLGYIIGKGNFIGSRKFVQEMHQCSHCKREGHVKDTCWDLHPCVICGLKNHLEKMCWQRKCKSEFLTGCMNINYGWNYGPDWHKFIEMLKNLFKYKCSYGKEDRNQERCVGLIRCHAKLKAIESERISRLFDFVGELIEIYGRN